MGVNASKGIAPTAVLVVVGTRSFASFASLEDRLVFITYYEIRMLMYFYLVSKVNEGTAPFVPESLRVKSPFSGVRDRGEERIRHKGGQAVGKEGHKILRDK